MAKYYVIGIKCSNKAGIGALSRYVAMEVGYAYLNNWIPVVDFKTYDNGYFKDDRKFQDNTWEYFYKQPANVGLEDIPSDVEIEPYIPEKPDILETYFDVSELPKTKKYNTQLVLEKANAHKKVFVFNDEIKDYIKERYQQIFQGEKDVLGVYCRGSDYFSLKPAGHPIQPKPNLVIRKAKKMLKKYGLKKIYLATEDSGIYEKFKKVFKDKLLDNGQYRYPSKVSKRLIALENNIPTKDFQYNLAREYFVSLYALGQCKYFIGGRTSGTVLAYIFQDNWEDFYIWDLGFYKKSIKPYLKKVLIVFRYKLLKSINCH